jgi:hypothetical protein
MISLFVFGRVKVHPRTCHDGPEGESKCIYTLSSTSALDGMSGQRHAPATLSQGNRPGTHFTGGISRKHRWKDNIKLDIRYIVADDVKSSALNYVYVQK